MFMVLSQYIELYTYLILQILLNSETTLYYHSDTSRCNFSMKPNSQCRSNEICESIALFSQNRLTRNTKDKSSRFLGYSAKCTVLQESALSELFPDNFLGQYFSTQLLFALFRFYPRFPILYAHFFPPRRCSYLQSSYAPIASSLLQSSVSRLIFSDRLQFSLHQHWLFFVETKEVWIRISFDFLSFGWDLLWVWPRSHRKPLFANEWDLAISDRAYYFEIEFCIAVNWLERW